ncbi:MAG: penicillin-binding transpeptidase domain-containing protein [Clostridium sp.]|nr:penicillin-binding transpeptidase domain-containing protein [Clostridium sp.]
MKKTNIRKLKQKELKSRKDSRLNKMLLRKRKHKKHKAERKLLKQNKINRSQMNKKGEVSRKRRMRFALICSTIIFLGLATRVGYIQFFEGEKLQQMAYLQQTLNRNINPKRGTIYDSSGKVELATSSSVETITVNPVNILSSEKEKVATELTQLFNLKYEDVLKKVSKKTAIETIAKKVDKNQSKELRLWMEANNITSGINIDEDTKRFYPYNNLASQIIGFCGSDNQGLAGIEAKYDNELKGEKGKILKMTDAKGIDITDTSEAYEPAKQGNDLVLSIDATIQGIAEKYLKEACIDNVCTDGGNILLMNPQNGDILAIASYPDFNLNDPYTINNEELKTNWSNMTATERSNALQAMWRNKSISDTYEPGSTFKLVTASTALEEGIVASTDKEGEFCCTGYIEVAGVKMKCWRYYRPHGPESLRQALMNSCNPVFIGLGGKIGVTKYYEYLRKYGFLGRTGIDLPGEAGSIFLKESKVGPVELGTIAFGQRFEVTPIQMITMVSTIANGGIYTQPRIVKQIINSQTGEIKNIETVKKDRVISEDTAKKMLSMMESVVAEGTGKNAQVKGYAIGGKTGTSEDGVNTGKYVTSFIGVAPISNPEVAILITLYNPTGEGGHQGGGVAAPIASQVLGEVLPYLEIKKDNQDEEEKGEVEVPNLIGLTRKEAKKTLEEEGLLIETKESLKTNLDDEDEKIKSQLPKAGIKIKQGSTVYVDK